MKITYILPALGYHQIPICEELYRQLGNDFCFIATQKIENGRFAVNYNELANLYPFVFKAYESEEKYQSAVDIINSSDVVVIGSAPKKYTDIVNKNKNILLLRYCERFYKKGIWRRFLPHIFWTMYKQIIKNNNRSNFAVLAASAYTSFDLKLTRAKCKIFKFGYFPKMFSYKVEELLSNKQKEPISILWSGRMIGLKHCEDAIKALAIVNKENFEFSFNIVGDGEEKDSIVKLVKDYGIEKNTVFYGKMETLELRKLMEKSNIYIFTSDFEEGWGAVLNEAMNSACAIITSNGPGSVPFLIKNNENGLIYNNGNIELLALHIKKLISDDNLREKLSINAYNTILNLWNSKVAANRLIQFSDEFIKTGDCTLFDDGPFSEAEIIEPKNESDAI